MNKTMYSYQSRLDSFIPAARLKSSTRGSSAIKWPHPPSFLATPTALASAGFYYQSSLGHDTVICFMCGKQLAEWEPSDDPAMVHAEKCPNCPWVILKCTNDADKNGSITFIPSRLPSSETMFKSRLATFVLNGQTIWPHDVKNRGPSAEAMATAGFIYTPANSKDDTCACIYCGIELRGWKRNDDPIEEHRGRQSRCPFFTEPVKGSIGNVRGRSKPKAFTLSNETAVSDREVSANGMKSSSLSTRAGTGARQKRAVKAKSSSSRKGHPKSSEDVVMEYEIALVVDGNEQPKRVRRGKSSCSKSTSRSRSRAKSEAEKPISDLSDSERNSQQSGVDIMTDPQPLDPPLKLSKKINGEIATKRKRGRLQQSEASEKTASLMPDEVKRAPSVHTVVVRSDDPTQVGIDIVKEEQQLDLQAETLTLLEGRHDPTIRSQNIVHSTHTVKGNKDCACLPGKPEEERLFAISPTFSLPPDRDDHHNTPIYSVVDPAVFSGLLNGQLTETERTMTVETWIRNEMEKEYERLKADGSNKIREFIAKAAEIARQIENL